MDNGIRSLFKRSVFSLRPDSTESVLVKRKRRRRKTRTRKQDEEQEEEEDVKKKEEEEGGSEGTAMIVLSLPVE